MSLATNWPAFLIAVVVVSITPGPAMALVIRRSALRGLRAGLATVAGLELGLYCWALLVASGVAVVAASQAGYLALKVVGCVVLGWLALRSFRAWPEHRRTPSAAGPATPEPGRDAPAATPRAGALAAVSTRPRLATLRAVGEGLIVQPANPKAAIFLLALYPQFVAREAPLFAATAVLGVVQVAIETVLYGALALFVARAADWSGSSVVRRRLEALTGTVLLALGVRLALSDRSG